ncbi:MAG: U32 family peptidase [Firmicutes bacterium]|nr:U32 family peptidase [Bacillota bacterium]
MMFMPELLAPVGNMECLKAAINAGCDAVYLSGRNFGARSFAGNFSREELEIAINTCHLYGVKVYITVNTLIYDVEVDRFIEYIDYIHQLGVDAVIMQDIGMIDLVRKTYPNLEIHASTQANIHNLEGVKLCEGLGIKRVVLARETPIELIKEIKDKTNAELEIFVHGALCMSYSGECLMSALIGNRSGNRGTCAQSCRQPYSLEIDGDLVSNNEYLLSTKDLNTLDNIGELIECGVDSLKIEGRMKRPEYVYLVTSLYRKAIDNYVKYGETKITENDIKNLKKLFNRQFTKGFLFNEENDSFVNTYRPNHLGIKIGTVLDYKKGQAIIKLNDNLNINDGIRIIGKNDTGSIVTIMYKNGNRVSNAFKGDIISIPFKETIDNNAIVLKTTDYNQIKEIEDKIKIDRKIKISGKCILKVGEPIKLIVSDAKNTVEKYSDYIVEKSQKSETTTDRIKEQLNKLGDTIYEFDNLEIEKDDSIFVPINKLNELRREVMNTLNFSRMYKTNYKKEAYDICVDNFEKTNNKNILISTYEQYLKVKDKYNIIYIDNLEEFNKIDDDKCVLKLDRINEHLSAYNQRLLVSDLGSVYKYKAVDTDFSLNVTNSYSVAFLHSLGVKKVTLSHELNYKQIRILIDNYKERYNKHPNLEVIVDANIEAMVCKYNMLKKYKVDEGYLIDRFNNKYKIKIKNNLMYIYDYKRTKLDENYFEIGINNIRINSENML